MTTPPTPAVPVGDDWAMGDPAGLGDVFQASENIGKLIAFVEPQRTEETTRFGTTEGTRCRYVVILDTGDIFDNTIIWGNLGKSAFGDGMQQIVLGRVTQGEAKAGQNAPYFLDPATDAEKATATEWFTANAVRSPQGRILIG